MAASTATKSAPAKAAPAADPSAKTPDAAQQVQVRDADVTVAKSRFDAETLTAIKMAEAWRPANSGDAITGTVVTILKRTNAEYGDYPAVVLNKSDDASVRDYTVVHAFHGVILNELKQFSTKPGDRITITYAGKRAANKLNADGSTKNYHGYSVVPTSGGELDTFEF